MKSMYRFDNGQAEALIKQVVGKDKVDVHREINVIANSEAEARLKARRPALDEPSGLPSTYRLVGVFGLSKDWQTAG